MVVDTHTHAWGPPSGDHPWVNGPLVEEFVDGFSVDTVYRADALVADMDAVGVDEAIVVGYPICDWTDNWYTVRAVEEHDRLYGIVMVDQFDDGAAEELRRLMDVDGILGFRLGAMCPYDCMWEAFDYDVTWLRDAAEETTFWDVARETDAVVQVLAHTTQLDQVAALVDRYPDRRYVLDHFAHASAGGDETESIRQFGRFESHDNVAIKLSEVAHLSNESYPYSDVHESIGWLLDTFGRERIVWGSDFPNVSHPEYGGMTYDETLSWLDHVPTLSEGDRRWVTERAIRSFADL